MFVQLYHQNHGTHTGRVEVCVGERKLVAVLDFQYVEHDNSLEIWHCPGDGAGAAQVSLQEDK
jgi:hypothetical protein